MKVIGMIPCRMNSSRFYGKAIANILDKPMIYWVYNQAKKVNELDEIYVVTSDLEIKNCRFKYNIPCICNPTTETTAAEKIAIESEGLDGDIYINIQGDEPLIEPNCIKQIVTAMTTDSTLEYVGLKSHIESQEEFNDPNVVKAVTDSYGFAMYFSRSPIPFNYKYDNAFRVMGLYGYRKNFLKNFKDLTKSTLEKLEQGIEMLRIMEAGYKIKLLDTSYNSIGVDLPSHIKVVEDMMSKSDKYGEYTDLYDDNKKKTDKKLFRAKGTKLEVPKGFYNIVVIIFIENSKGEFLFQKTSKSKGSIWAVTGGHVKSNETSKEAIINELKEELGLDIDINEVKLFKTYKYDSAFKDVYYLKKDIDINKLNCAEDEVSNVKYFTKNEISKMIEKNKIRKTNIDAYLDIIKSD